MIITKEMIRYAADRYINTDESIGEVAKLIGVSKTALVKHFEGTYDSTRLDPKRQAAVDKTKEEKWIKGKSTSGNAGHKKLSDEVVIGLAKKMIDNNLTLRDLETSTSTSTLFNLLNKETLGEDLYSALTDKYEEHKTNATKNIKGKKII